jgi:hypothetical protein
MHSFEEAGDEFRGKGVWVNEAASWLWIPVFGFLVRRSGYENGELMSYWKVNRGARVAALYRLSLMVIDAGYQDSKSIRTQNSKPSGLNVNWRCLMEGAASRRLNNLPPAKVDLVRKMYNGEDLIWDRGQFQVE